VANKISAEQRACRFAKDVSLFVPRVEGERTFMAGRTIFITGGTGFMGRSLIPEILKRGHNVRALARRGSEAKLPQGCAVILGDPLDRATFANEIRPADTFVQLVGVSHPSPAKASQFRTVDLQSARESIQAAAEAGVEHFIYVSVAQPAPIMKAYIEARAEAEALIVESGLKRATILRPWYVLGPGRQWPRILRPVYWILERLPSKRETARRLGLLTDEEMRGALLSSIENSTSGIRILTVPEIRSIAENLNRNA
jgi:uncharacterized protein YbjT (DUF2867 family)